MFSFQMAGADCVLQPSMPLARGRGMQTQSPYPAAWWRVIYVVALIEHQLETIGMFKEYAVHRQDLTESAEARRFSYLPRMQPTRFFATGLISTGKFIAPWTSSSVCNGSEEAKMCRRL